MKTKRNNFLIMLSLIKLLRPLVLPMLIAIVMGVLGFISAFGIPVFAVYAIFSAIPKFSIVMAGLFLGGLTTKIYLTLLLACGFLRGALHYIEQYCNHLLAFKILAIIRQKVFAAMRRLAPAKLDTKNPGQLISLIMGDIELLEVFYAHTISPIAIAAITAILLFCFYTMLNPILVIVPLISQIVIGIIFPFIASKKGSATSAEIRNEIGELNGKFIDNLRGVSDILQYNCGRQELQNLDTITEQLFKKQAKIKNQATNLFAFIDAGIIIFSIAQGLVCLHLIQQNAISAPVAVIATILTASSFAPYISLASLGNTLTHTFACGERVLSILEEEPIIQPVTNGINLEKNYTENNANSFDKNTLQNAANSFESNNNPFDIELEAVDFSYAEDKAIVLHNLNLNIRQNEIVGLVGESGRGKSTILKLLLRFWEPNSGEVKIGGHNLKEVNTESIYKNINYMTQTTNLFAGTLRSNLLIAKPSASDEEIMEALKKAAIHDFVKTLPNGLDTIVGEEGVNFSGGEKQRLGLARCFLADKPILLLDEPTSNIDSINEAIILRAISRERKNKTIIFVSHRPSTLSICDRIVEAK